MARTGQFDEVISDGDAAHRNRRRARAIVALPGVVVFGVVAIVLTALGDPIPGLIAGAAVGVAVSLAFLLGGTALLLRALSARRTDENSLPRAHNLTEGLCASMGLPLPSIWLVDDPARNALSLGRGPRTAALVLTSGLAEEMDPVALEGVLAHELTHVKRGDIAPATLAAAVSLPLAPFLPGIGAMVHGLAGRGREFRTDQLAVAVTRYPPGLRQALSLVVSGPAPSVPSSLRERAAAKVTTWLWTVAAADGHWQGASSEAGLEPIGELDAASVRIAALDEW